MSPADHLKITRSEEDYLKAMLNLTQSGQSITTNTIADKINVSPPSVNSMVKKLNRKGMILGETTVVLSVAILFFAALLDAGI